MLLLTSDENELHTFLSSSENQRDAKFGAYQVRGKLDTLEQPNLVDKFAYRNFSRRLIVWISNPIVTLLDLKRFRVVNNMSCFPVHIEACRYR